MNKEKIPSPVLIILFTYPLLYPWVTGIIISKKMLAKES